MQKKVFFGVYKKKKSIRVGERMEVRQRLDLVEEKLSAVAWVDNKWFALVCVLLFGMNVASALSTDGVLAKSGSATGQWIVFAFLLATSVLVSYPYWHYRQSGGYVKRIPPRFNFDKPFFTRDAIKEKYKKLKSKFFSKTTKRVQ